MDCLTLFTFYNCIQNNRRPYSILSAIFILHMCTICMQSLYKYFYSCSGIKILHTSEIKISHVTLHSYFQGWSNIRAILNNYLIVLCSAWCEFSFTRFAITFSNKTIIKRYQKCIVLYPSTNSEVLLFPFKQ